MPDEIQGLFLVHNPSYDFVIATFKKCYISITCRGAEVIFNFHDEVPKAQISKRTSIRVWENLTSYAKDKIMEFINHNTTLIS